MSRTLTRQQDVKFKSRPKTAVFILIGGAFLLLFMLAISISVGANDDITLSAVWHAFFHFDEYNAQHQVVYELRAPRTLAGAVIGAAFAVSGALMQGNTRNAMADPSLLGINAGAGFALALCFAFLPGLSFQALILFSFAGSAMGTGLVFGIGALAKGKLSPVRLVLAGAMITAMLTSISEGIAIYFRISQDLTFWYAGGMAGTTWLQLQTMTPWILAGLTGAILLSRSITLLSLGDDVAAGLGQRTGIIRLSSAMIVLVLAGASVSVAGAVGFIGLIVPHIARYLVGVDYRWIIPCSAIIGGLLVVTADIGAKMVNAPYEAPLGAVISLIGVPFFFYLARREKRLL